MGASELHAVYTTRMYAPSPILDLVPFRAGVAAFAASTSAAASAASAAPARAAWSSSTWHSHSYIRSQAR